MPTPDAFAAGLDRYSVLLLHRVSESLTHSYLGAYILHVIPPSPPQKENYQWGTISKGLKKKKIKVKKGRKKGGKGKKREEMRWEEE